MTTRRDFADREPQNSNQRTTIPLPTLTDLADRNNPKAWECLQRGTRAIARSLVGTSNAAEIDDIASRVLVKVCEQLPTIRHLPSWLWRVVGNEISQTRRHSHTNYTLMDIVNGAATFSEMLPEPDDQSGQESDSDCLKSPEEYLDQLPPKQHQAVMLRQSDPPLSLRQIAEQMNIAPSSVNNLLKRAHARLRRLMKDTKKLGR